MPGIVRANVHAPISTEGLSQDDMPALKEQVYQLMSEKLKKEGYK